jgi:hypothetical protein
MSDPKLFIITPCSRPENLETLKNSIHFDKITQWYIIYDTRNKNFKKNYEGIDKIIELECKNEGIVGHQIRNFALDIIEEGLIYFLDDDTIMHPFFWTLLENCTYDRIYTWNLMYKLGHVLQGNNPVPGKIDMSQFLCDRKLVANLRFQAHNYSGDGVFINELCLSHNEKTLHFNYIASYYNWLNTNQLCPL